MNAINSALYFESHVTIEPVTGERLDEFKNIARNWAFRVADLIMIKPGVGETPSSRDSFATCRHKNYAAIEDMTAGLIHDLQAAGFDVWRYKIEDTVMDSKIHDALELFGSKVSA